MDEAPPVEDRVRRRWHASLYARALLALTVGCGAVIGAAVVQTMPLVREAEERVLDDRMKLARVTGDYVLHRVSTDLELLDQGVRGLLGQAEVDRAGLRAALAARLPSTLFDEGAFVLRRDGAALALAPSSASELLAAVDLAPLVSRALERDGPVASALVPAPGQAGRVLVVLTALRTSPDRVAGLVGGVLHPAVDDLLGELRRSPGPEIDIDVVDRLGVVVASDDPASVFRPTDHDEILQEAVAEGREVRGRCHACHETRTPRPVRTDELLAFAPVPGLGLGVAVRQPEALALEPAQRTRRRLLTLTAALAGLFVLFAGLSIRSVVRPVTRLTAAVERHHGGRAALELPRFGEDEVGVLARALQRWQKEAVESLDALEEQRRARFAEDLRRRALGRILDAQESERRRVARDLHDTVAQELAAHHLALERLADRAEAEPVSEKITALGGDVREMLETLRRILLDLRLSVLEDMGFVAALQWQLERLSSRHGIATSFTYDGVAVSRTDPAAVALFRILLESLQNIVQHAEASYVFVTVDFGEEEVSLAIEDDGVGFDTAALRPDAPGAHEDGRGLGVLGMRERAELLGGSLKIESAPGAGTTVWARVPRGAQSSLLDADTSAGPKGEPS